MTDDVQPSGDEVPMDEPTRAAAERKVAGLQKKLRSLTEADVSVVNIEIRVNRASLLGPGANIQESKLFDSDVPGSPHPCDEGDADVSDPVDEDPLTTMD